MIQDFSDEQARVIVNLEQAYHVWMETLRAINERPYNMRIKEVSGREYLYEVTDRLGTKARACSIRISRPSLTDIKLRKPN